MTKRSPDTLQRLYDYVAAHPGCRKAELARAIGYHHQDIDSVLANLETVGLLLSEDERARLYTMETN